MNEMPEPEKNSLLERVGRREKSSYGECLEAYGNMVWSMTKQRADSAAEAETVAAEIFGEIWKYAARFDARIICEKEFVALIAFRYLYKKFGSGGREEKQFYREEKSKPETKSENDFGFGGETINTNLNAKLEFSV